MLTDIKIYKNENPKTLSNPDELGFGTKFTDHMFVMDYEEGKGWFDPRVVPYGPVSLEPSAMVFHYAQETFEGLKAYKTKTGEIQLFRPIENAKRLNMSNERLGIPRLDENLVVEAIKTVVDVDKRWIPEAEGTSLYIRPFVIATEPILGLKSSSTFKFFVILSPVGSYYKEGLNPTRIYVQDKYIRAAKGGTGYAKTGGNYASSIRALMEAKEKGYSQVLWLDGVEKKYVEEVGTSNAFFKIDGEVITAPLEGTILPGITRNSVITLLKSWGVKVSERKLAIDEVYEAYKSGKLEEVFATGTAAVISPIGELGWKGHDMAINDKQIGELSQKLYDTITGIQSGEIEDQFDWITTI